MSDNIEDATPLILQKIQDDISDFRKSVETRLDRLEDVGRKQRRDAAGMLVIMRATVSDYEARVTEIEERVTALERRPS